MEGLVGTVLKLHRSREFLRKLPSDRPGNGKRKVVVTPAEHSQPMTKGRPVSGELCLYAHQQREVRKQWGSPPGSPRGQPQDKTQAIGSKFRKKEADPGVVAAHATQGGKGLKYYSFQDQT